MVTLQKYDVWQYRIVRDQLIANVVLVFLATVMVVLRYIARRMRQNRIWWDDAWVTSSLIFTYGMLAMHFTYAKYGMRHHITELPAQNQVFIAKQLIAYQIVYYAAMATVKQAYLFFYLRIFVDNKFLIAARVCTAMVFGYWAGSMMQIFLICTPFEMNWNPYAGGHCASYNVAFTTIGIVNMVTDLIIMLLPIPFIRSLQMAIGAKIGLYLTFLIGLFVTAITIIRINVLLHVDFNDLSYSMPDAAFWSVAEPAVAIANCCVPTLRPLLKKISPARLWASNKDGSYAIKGSADRKGGTGQSSVSKDFNRLNDEYPLTRIEDGVTTINISAGKDGEQLEVDDDSLRQQSSGGYEQSSSSLGGIVLRQEWNVSNHRVQSAGNLL